MRAGQFIREFVEPIYFRKEELLLQALEDCGFPPDEGPVGNMRTGQKKAAGISNMLIEAARHWSEGDELGRGDVVWATSEYTGQMRQHLELLRNRIYPLLEQSISPEDEQALSVRVNHLDFGSPMTVIRDKYLKIVESMEEEVSDWR
jgi:hemerythrin-like domain-containing protein